MIGQALLADTIEKLYTKAMLELPSDVKKALQDAIAKETNPQSKMILETMLENSEVAVRDGRAICQDNGVNTHFFKVGTRAQFEGDPYAAVAEGVRRATLSVPLRPTVVNSLTRENYADNTNERVPIVYVDLLPGADYIEIITVPKGFGSENMSNIVMLNPNDGLEGVKKFVLDTVFKAGGRPCPPIVVGVGCGGTFDLVAKMAKIASSLRPVGSRNPNPFIADMEDELLEMVNSFGTGALGVGGVTTAMDLHIEHAGTHIAGNPVAVNLQCWATRRAAARIYNDGRVEFLDASIYR